MAVGITDDLNGIDMTTSHPLYGSNLYELTRTGVRGSRTGGQCKPYPLRDAINESDKNVTVKQPF